MKKVKYNDKLELKECCSRCGSFDVQLLSDGTKLCKFKHCMFVDKKIEGGNKK